MKDSRKIVHEFIGVNRMHHRAIENAVRGLQIHHSGHRLLMFLAHSDAVPSQKEIAARFDISPAAVTGAIKKLEKGGFIRRDSDETDSRMNRIYVTEKGKAIYEKTRTLFDGVDEAMLKDFSEEERETLSHLLLRMKKNLADYGEDGEETV